MARKAKTAPAAPNAEDANFGYNAATGRGGKGVAT